MSANVTSNRTVGPLVSPITAEELADFMNMEYLIGDKPLLDSFLLAACEMCIAYTNNELLSRTWVYKLDRSPAIFSGSGGLGPVPASLSPWVSLPLVPVSSITSVTVDSVAYTDFTTDLSSAPVRVDMQDTGINIEITYVAGHATAATIDNRLIMGIKILGSYLFENRGCSMSQAIEASGAGALWYTIRMLTGGL